MRTLLLTTLLWLTASVAVADIPPDPGRPDFDDTPLPMPDEPEASWPLIAAAVAIGVGALVMRRRRRAC